MLKKQTYLLEADLQNVNIDGLNERFEKVCLLDSNDQKNDKSDSKSAKLIALGSTQDLVIHNTDNALKKIQDFYDQRKGWLFGYMSYDLKNGIEKLSSENYDRMKFPVTEFFSPQVVLQILGDSVFVFHDDEFLSEQEAKSIFELTFSEKSEKADVCQKMEIKAETDKATYLHSVNKLKEHIRKGDIYEVNFCQEFYSENAVIDPVEVYHQLNLISAAPFSAYCKFGKKYLMCASPERFLQKHGGRLISQPIKGTIRRSENAKEDEALKAELLHNTKERSENVMIVDLVRNDLSRIAKKGSVKVDELFGIYTFKQVHQMISTVSCEPAEGVSFSEILKSTFPMGSMTGAPKISAMKLIEEYESTRRGLYSGAVGYIDHEGNFDFNVVIRSILYNSENKTVSFMAGSAITDKSDPEKEYEECLLKAKAMFKVLGTDN